MKISNKSLNTRTLTTLAGSFAAALALLGSLTATFAASSEGEDSETGFQSVEKIKIGEGQLLYEIIGQVINFTPTTSTQFGYYTYIKGIDGLFAGAPENETTAWFTFHRETTNLRVTANGPLRIISREGTTTVYLNAAPAGNFSNPDSFRAGTPIQTSTLRQQVIVDTVTQTFTVVNEDTITSSSPFSVNGSTFRIGKVGDIFRTTKNGHLTSPVPSGYFAGYSVGAEKSK
jgi:hypothetical protein